MSILAKAKAIADESRDKRKAELAKEIEAQEKWKQFIQDTKDRLIRFIETEINGQHDFVTEPHNIYDTNGVSVVSILKHKGSCCGFFTVGEENYTFRGSDESPEETLYHVVVALRVTPSINGKVLASYGINHSGVLEEGIEEFGKRLAEHLSRYF